MINCFSDGTTAQSPDATETASTSIDSKMQGCILIMKITMITTLILFTFNDQNDKIMSSRFCLVQ